MTHRLRPGVYEDMITAALEAEIKARREDGWRVDDHPADATSRPEFLARHVYELLRRALEAIHGDDDAQVASQVALANRLVEALFEHGAMADDRVAEAARLLIEAADRRELGDSPPPLPRPTLSFRRTGLLVNGRRDVQIVSEIAREIPSADRIDLLCAFVRHSGLRLFRSELEARASAGAEVRVIASVYTGSTERRALDALIALGARVKVSYEIARTRLHAKAWLFHRESGLHTAYIGSSNLTHAAQVDGLEWNVRVSAVENPEVIERFSATFEQYWQEPEFEDYEPGRDAERLDRALSRQIHGGSPDDGLDISLLVDVAPKPHQAVALEALESERQSGHRRNLVVAATGTGKTWIAAFDFRRLRSEGNGDSLLFVAHRDEILRQSQQVFQLVLREPGFGERLVGGERPRSGRHVFASVQSLANRVDDIEPDGFDVVIVDEFHHAAAASYDRLLKRLRPKFLLGLTATPERADGKSVLEWFDGRTAFESRLWDALDQGLLCPFHYFGVNDATDLSTVRFERGRYVAGDLDNVLTGDHVRALRVRHAVEEYVSDPHRMRALGFCAGIAHAHFSVELRREINDLLDILDDRIRTVAQPLDGAADVPLASHATYSLGEVAAAHGRVDERGALVLPQTGVLWDEATQTDLLFITLEKSDADFSPTTRYADYPISPTLFHWESQNSASADTPTGRRYVEQPARGTNVILFVRERKRDGRGVTLPYCCLGRAHYRRHESERPMKVLWKLERPMPGWLYQVGKVVAG